MKLSITLVVAVGFAIFSCSKGRDSDSNDEISGAYVREYSFKIVNPGTGSEIGMRTVRDTIFVHPVEDGFEVSNNKWKLNDYDRGGWTNMEHAEDRPMPTYRATFSTDYKLLHAESVPDLLVDLRKKTLFKEKKKDQPYKKVR